MTRSGNTDHAARLKSVLRGAGAHRTPAFLAIAVQGAQILLGVVSIPMLLRALGPQRFSALAILWALPSLIPLIDLGLSRALASMLVQRRYRDETAQQAVLVLAVGMQTCVLIVIALVALLPFSRVLVPQSIASVTGESAAAGATLTIFLAACAILTVTNILAAFFQARGDLYTLFFVNSFSGLAVSAIPLSVVFAVPTLQDLGTYTLAVRISGLALSSAFVLSRLDWRLAWERCGNAWVISKDLLSSGAKSLWYFAISPLLVFGERYIASYGDGRTQIVSHLIAVDLGLRFLIVPGILGQYSFRTIADSAKETSQFDTAVASYMPMISAIYLLPLLGAVCFGRELLHIWLGPTQASGITLVCLQSVLIALATCAVSSLLVQTTLAADAMQRLSILVIVELILYPPVVFGAIFLRPSSVDLSLVLSICWAGRVAIEAGAMALLTKDMFARGSLIDFAMLTALVPATASVLAWLADGLVGVSVVALKATVLVSLGTASHCLICWRAGKRT